MLLIFLNDLPYGYYSSSGLISNIAMLYVLCHRCNFSCTCVSYRVFELILFESVFVILVLVINNHRHVLFSALWIRGGAILARI